MHKNELLTSKKHYDYEKIIPHLYNDDDSIVMRSGTDKGL